METRFVPKITEPCGRRWSEMAVYDKKSYCEHCQLHVHNFSAMSPKEQREVLKPGEGSVCVTYRVDPGTVPVSAGKWVIIQRAVMPLKACAAVMAVLMATLLPSHAADKDKAIPPPSTVATASASSAKEAQDVDYSKMPLGIICEPPALWRRILFFWRY
jgi:hypothetical protein